MTRALLVLGVVGATPALGQPVAEITLAPIALPEETITFTFGEAQTFAVEVTNHGPSRATGVVVTVTRPNAGETWPADPEDPAITIPKTEITGFGGCTRIGTTDSCRLDTIVDFTPGVTAPTVTVTFDVVLNLPPLMPESCPSPSLLTGMAVSVDVDEETSCEGCPLSDSVPGDAFEVAPYAKLETKVTGPATATQGQTIAFATTVKNLGPCTAPAAYFEIDTLGGFLLDQAITGPACLVIDDESGICDLGDLTAGTIKAFAVGYKVGQVTQSVNFISTGQQFGGTAYSDIQDPGFTASAVATTVVPNTPGGCDSAGGGGLVGLLGLLGFAIRRRFT